MDEVIAEVIAEYQRQSSWSLISQHTLSKWSAPDDNQPYLLKLEPLEGHAVLVAIIRQSLTIPDWPGCSFFAVRIRAIHYCCQDADVLKAARNQIGSTIGHICPKIAIDISKALLSASIQLLPIDW